MASKSWKGSAKVFLYNFFNERTTQDFMRLLEGRSCLGSLENYALCQEIPICEPFWEYCGNSIKMLSLYGIKFQGEHDFRTAVYKACSNMELLSLGKIEIRKSGKTEAVEPLESVQSSFPEHKKLKSLTIKSMSFWDNRNSGVSWTELFGHFPQLRSLEVVGDVGINLKGLFKSFRQLRRLNSANLQLKNFAIKADSDKFHLHPFPSSFAVLKDTGLQLESIKLGEICGSDDLTEILELHAASLKKFHLNGSISENVPNILDPYDIFPLATPHGCLEALHELELTKDSFRSLAILKFMPNLQHLAINCNNYHFVNGQTEWSDMEDVLVENCKSLRINNYLSVNDVQKLICWIPNLEKLEIFNAENAHFEKICEGWPNLVTLILKWSRVEDCGISGLDKKDVDRINKFGEWSSWRPITVPRANITSLKNLKGFYMETNNNLAENELGYCAAVCGIEKLSNLQGLHVDKFNRQGQMQRRLHDLYPRATLSNCVVLFLLILAWIGNVGWKRTIASFCFAKIFL